MVWLALLMLVTPWSLRVVNEESNAPESIVSTPPLPTLTAVLGRLAPLASSNVPPVIVVPPV